MSAVPITTAIFDRNIWSSFVLMKLMKYSRDENFVRFRFGDELKELANMGFLNEELNLHLIQMHLKHCQVNLQAVIEELQANQTSSCFMKNDL